MTLASARKISCSLSNCLLLSNERYLALSFEIPITLVMREEREVGKEG